MEDLYGRDLEEWLSGYRAAQRGHPFDEHGTTLWLLGFRDYHAMKAGKADEVRKCGTLH